jgi:hypothetical protein
MLCANGPCGRYHWITDVHMVTLAGLIPRSVASRRNVIFRPSLAPRISGPKAGVAVMPTLLELFGKS